MELRGYTDSAWSLYVRKYPVNADPNRILGLISHVQVGKCAGSPT